MTKNVPLYDMFSPSDYRYNVEELVPFLSEEGFVKYKARVESALAEVQAERGLLSHEAASKIGNACSQITAEEVNTEEDKTRHDIIALRNMIQKRLRSKEAKSGVHRFATSYDIVETANAVRYSDAMNKVIIPDMVQLEKSWIDQAREERDTLQIGRTHLQHAEPITYGFTLAWYLHRFGERILRLVESAENLKGKFSGSVGAYNALSLFFDDPESFEKDIMRRLTISPAEISTQIAPPEPITDLVHYVVSAFGILANWADDMRNLQRPEIAEVGQPRRSMDTSTSSIMPHKVNPVGLENVKSLYKATMPFMITMYLDQMSDHQRDLTNSASQRYLPMILDQFDYAVRRSVRIAKKLKSHKHNMQRNLEMSAQEIISEPTQIMLSAYGHPNAHHYIEELIDRSIELGKSLVDMVFEDETLRPYLAKLSPKQINILRNPSSYKGIASQKSADTADMWESRLKESGLL